MKGTFLFCYKSFISSDFIFENKKPDTQYLSGLKLKVRALNLRVFQNS